MVYLVCTQLKYKQNTIMYEGCAEVDGTAAPDAVSLGVVLKYFKSASEERREVYVTTACYILIKKQMLGVLYMRLI